MVAPIGTRSLGKTAKLYDEWKYASVIVMLIYVANKYRPDISCSSSVRKVYTKLSNSHEKAILHICKYLKQTSTDGNARGLIIFPFMKMQVDCYVDADVSGIYDK